LFCFRETSNPKVKNDEFTWFSGIRRITSKRRSCYLVQLRARRSHLIEVRGPGLRESHESAQTGWITYHPFIECEVISRVIIDLRSEMAMLLIIILLVLIFGFGYGGYRAGPGWGYYGGGSLSLILTIVLILLLLKII
jgi:Protein of unknown function (DUF3309)